LNDTHFVQRPGGATYRVSPLNAAFLDRHESWYAVHWTTQFRPYAAVNFCVKELDLSPETCGFVQSAKEAVTRASLNELRRQFRVNDESTQFLRFDAQDYVLVWEKSGEYERLRSAGEDVPFTAIFGFGTDRFDPRFGSRLLRETATRDIARAGESIWKELGFLEGEFKHGEIHPSRGYKQ
jgi:hypothetical protein